MGTLKVKDLLEYIEEHNIPLDSDISLIMNTNNVSEQLEINALDYYNPTRDWTGSVILGLSQPKALNKIIFNILKQILILERSGGSLNRYEMVDYLKLLEKISYKIDKRFKVVFKFQNQENEVFFYSKKAALAYLQSYKTLDPNTFMVDLRRG